MYEDALRVECGYDGATPCVLLSPTKVISFKFLIHLQILGLDTRCRRIETVRSLSEESSSTYLRFIKDYLRHLSLILRLVLVEAAFLARTLSRQIRMVLPSFSSPNLSSAACKMVRLHPMSFDWVLVNWLPIIVSSAGWTIRTKNTSLPLK